MKKKKINVHESLMANIVGSIMLWATKNDIDKDPEFQKKIKIHNRNIANISQDIEDILVDLEKRHNTKIDRSDDHF